MQMQKSPIFNKKKLNNLIITIKLFTIAKQTIWHINLYIFFNYIDSKLSDIINIYIININKIIHFYISWVNWHSKVNFNAHQGFIYLTKNTVKTVIILQFKITDFYLNIF